MFNFFKKVIFLGLSFGSLLPEAHQLTSLDRLCVLKSDVNLVYFYIFYPEKLHCIEFECHPDLSNLKIQREIRYNLLLCESKDKTKKKSQKSQATRTLLVDEYLLKIPFLLKLQCPHELKTLVGYLKKKFGELRIEPISNVPLLIALDYGLVGSVCKNHAGKSLESELIDSEEIEFLNKYFNIYAEKHAQIFFGFYHRMLFQLNKIKRNFHSESSGFAQAFEFIKTSVKELGIVEVLYRIFLIKLIIFLGQHSSKGFGVGFVKWILRGARRGAPECELSSSLDLFSSQASRSSDSHRVSIADSIPPLPAGRNSGLRLNISCNRLPPCEARLKRRGLRRR